MVGAKFEGDIAHYLSVWDFAHAGRYSPGRRRDGTLCWSMKYIVVT